MSESTLVVSNLSLVGCPDCLFTRILNLEALISEYENYGRIKRIWIPKHETHAFVQFYRMRKMH
ncbi:hypothetical protein A3Q56_07374 [Intoshia linei]|uniref:Uncharacterized protein n=1 Tax=Intoshia linei TaxID=1819745 RepID=A0A177ASC7_9BILA|nr:hypothetical protein A3Q56_07374 [Intoshia linei]